LCWILDESRSRGLKFRLNSSVDKFVEIDAFYIQILRNPVTIFPV